jgi:hypothetical protein
MANLIIVPERCAAHFLSFDSSILQMWAEVSDSQGDLLFLAVMADHIDIENKRNFQMLFSVDADW